MKIRLVNLGTLVILSVLVIENACQLERSVTGIPVEAELESARRFTVSAHSPSTT